MADGVAKMSAEPLSQQQSITSSASTLDFSTLKMIIKDQQTKAWQLSWERSTSGSTTRALIPTVEKKVVRCGIRSVDISYARILSVRETEKLSNAFSLNANYMKSKE